MTTGPAPKHPSRRARRNNPKSDFRVLSSKGRKGPAPAWPLQADVKMTATLEQARDKVATLTAALAEATDGRTKGRLRRQLDQASMVEATTSLQLEQARDAEVALWGELWATPQALMWDESSAFNREVAQYVRWKIRAEQGDLDAGKEARMLSDRLGLNPLALLRLRREVEETAAAEDRGVRRRTASPAKPADGDEAKGKASGEDDDDPRGGLFAVS